MYARVIQDESYEDFCQTSAPRVMKGAVESMSKSRDEESLLARAHELEEVGRILLGACIKAAGLLEEVSRDPCLSCPNRVKGQRALETCRKAIEGRRKGKCIAEENLRRSPFLRAVPRETEK